MSNKKNKNKKKIPRNPIAVALRLRGGHTKIMHDKRDERGGSKNKQVEYLKEE